MKTIYSTILFVLFLLACQSPPESDSAALSTTPGNQPPATAAPTVPNAAALANTPAAGPAATSLLTAMGQTMSRLDSLQWEAHIIGEFTSTSVNQVGNETNTTCTLVLPNESYCITQELVDATGTVSDNPLELLQIGTDQWGRQSDSSWQPLTGSDRPRSIILHELFRLQNGRLLFFANDFVTSAEITGQETRHDVETTIVTIEFDPDAYDLYAMWYGEEVTIPDAQQRFTSKLWIGTDGRLYESESRLETAVQGDTTLLTLTTTYGRFNETLEIPRP